MKKRIYTKEPEGKWLCTNEIRKDKNGVNWMWELIYFYEVKDGKRTGWADYKKAIRKCNWDKEQDRQMRENIRFIFRGL